MAMRTSPLIYCRMMVVVWGISPAAPSEVDYIGQAIPCKSHFSVDRQVPTYDRSAREAESPRGIIRVGCPRTVSRHVIGGGNPKFASRQWP